MFKKILIVLFISLIVFNALSFKSLAKIDGEILKGMGYVVGFKNGRLHEESLMKQGELVVLIASYIQKNLIKHTTIFIEEKNGFDQFANRFFYFFYSLYFKLKVFFIRAYYEITNREIYPSFHKKHFMFNYLVELKTYGF